MPTPVKKSIPQAFRDRFSAEAVKPHTNGRHKPNGDGDELTSHLAENIPFDNGTESDDEPADVIESDDAPPRDGPGSEENNAHLREVYLRAARELAVEHVPEGEELPPDVAADPFKREAVERHRERLKRDARFFTAIEEMMKLSAELPFPIQVYPPVVCDYIRAWSASLLCSHDLLAVPLLAVAGAATGRSGRRLQVKDGWRESSCLWAVCIASSSDGKSPALSAVECFYQDRQKAELLKWQGLNEEFKKR